MKSKKHNLTKSKNETLTHLNNKSQEAQYHDSTSGYGEPDEPNESPKVLVNNEEYKQNDESENIEFDENEESKQINDFPQRKSRFRFSKNKSEIAKDELINDDFNIKITSNLSENPLKDQDGEDDNINDLQVPLNPSYGQAKSEGNTEKRKKKTLFLGSDDLKKLNLKYGKNTITYSVDANYGGKQENTSRIFLWNYKVKIIISDVDGTITKSDVLGHILPRFGKDWSHQGVAELYTNIRKNGYEFLYLTSRAIGMADSTRSYLQTLEQENTFKLPDGPCIMSPDRLMHSFKREVIDRKPHIFKIAALWNVKNIFKEDINPFYAGFGNRDTDAISYRAMGISLKNIFIINPQSEVIMLHSMYK